MVWTAFGGIGSNSVFDNVQVFDADVAFEIDSANHKFSNCFVSGAFTDKAISDIADPGDGRGTGGIQVINCNFGSTIMQFNVPRIVQVRNTICGQVIAAGGQDYDIEVVLQPFVATDYPIDLTAVKGLNLTLLGAHGSSPLDHRVAVHLDTVTHFSLNGSVLWANDHGVFLENCAYGEDSLLVQGASVSSNGAFQGKRLTTCSNIKVAGGVKHLGLGNKPNYGIQIDADCTNIEIDCHLEDSGATGPINNLAAFEVWTHAKISTEDPNDNDVLVWDDANGIWRPEAGGGGGGGGLDLTTKGDLHTFDTADVALGVGTNGEALFADSATGTGLNWRPIVEADISDLDHTDPSAVHDNVAGEIAALTQVTPSSTDHILIEDASDTNNKKRVAAGDLFGSGADPDAIHDNVAGEIAVITQKGSPVAGDFLLIEDSADSNSKKRIEIGDLPGGGGGASISSLGSSIPGTVTYITPNAARRYVRKITVASAGLVLNVNAYLRQTVANVWGGPVRVALFDDDSGTPGKLLGFNEAISINNTVLLNTTAQTPRWVSFPINVPVVAADYWLSIWIVDTSDITLGTDATTGVGTGISGYITAGGGWLIEKGATGYGFTATNNEEQLLQAQVLA